MDWKVAKLLQERQMDIVHNTVRVCNFNNVETHDLLRWQVSLIYKP